MLLRLKELRSPPRVKGRVLSNGTVGLFLSTQGKEGHAPKIIVGPNSTRIIPSGIALDEVSSLILVTTGPGLLAASCVLAGAQLMSNEDELHLPIYNTAYQSAYLTDGIWLATLIPLSDIESDRDSIRG